MGETDFPAMPSLTRSAKRPASPTPGLFGSRSAGAIPVQEIGLVAIVAVAVYILLAIVSYSAMDPAWPFDGTNLAVSNWVGQSGAYTADLMLLAFGWAAYMLPAGLAAAVVPALRPRRGEARQWPTPSWMAARAVGFAATLVSVCVLLRLHLAIAGELPAGTGGVLGDSLVTLGMPALNPAGLTLCALALLMIGSQAALGYSWLQLAEWTGRGLWELFAAAARLGRHMARLGVAAAGALATRMAALRRGVSKADHASASPAEDVPLPTNDGPPPASPAAGEAPADVPAPVESAPADESPLPAPPQPLDVRPSPPPAPATRDETPIQPPRLPGLDLLEEADLIARGGYSRESLEAMSRLLEVKLADFKVQAEVVSVQPGPVVTRFELQPAAGVKVSKITGLAKDLARSLAVVSVRIVEIIPGKSVVGIEIPNEQRETVRLKEILSSPQFETTDSPLTLALGKDIAGVPVMSDIGKMPHLLVAGTTGSGKSVGVNAMLLSMLYKAQPEDLRLILVDPKMLELAVYDGIPHLLTPVVTDMKDAAQALNWCVAEMERRYQLMAAFGVRNIGGFNKRVTDAGAGGEPLADPLWPQDAVDPAPNLSALPYIVVVIDEFADMMMIVGKKVEQLIARIAQKARAAGIHLVLATQRPSVDVITGLIKANIPARLSFQVSSRIDSRTILDQGGAEQLLGHGDMLFLPPGTSVPVRVHGAFVSDEEVHAVAADWKARGQPDYLAEVVAGTVDTEIPGTVDLSEEAKGGGDSGEPSYDEAVAFVVESRRASISAVQRKLRIGYNRAARLIEAMEEAGVVSAMNSQGNREVLVAGGVAE